ncbi:hypothetical protein ACQCVE_09100 [Metabacillus sp. 113a]
MPFGTRVAFPVSYNAIIARIEAVVKICSRGLSKSSDSTLTETIFG